MQIVNLCKALSDPTRVRLLNILLSFELNVGELVALMDMGQSRISRHLKILTDSGLINFRRDGLWVFYKAGESKDLQEFMSGIRHLLKKERDLENDLERAVAIIRKRTQDTKFFFESVASQWSRLSREELGHLDLSEEITARVPKCKVLVDLGCGPGDLINSLKQQAGLIIGVDNSPKMLELASKRLQTEKHGISLRIGELEHLPLRDQEADVAVMSMVLHHLANPEAAIAEIGRTLKKEGRLIIADFCQHEKEIMRGKYGDRWLGFSPQQIKKWMIRADFEIQELNCLQAGAEFEVLLAQASKR